MPERLAGQGWKAVQSVERALGILEAVADEGPLNLTELAERVALSPSTTYRLLQTMTRLGFIRHDRSTGRYRLGLKALKIGAVAIRQFDLRAVARPHLRQLVEQCNETANLVVLDGAEVVYVDQVECSNMVRMLAELGSRLPATCTGAGKAILAFLPPEELEHLLAEQPLVAYTPYTITAREEFQANLEAVRRRGYAVDNEERELGVRCVAAPIRDAAGKVVAAVSVSGPTARLSGEYIERHLGPLVREYADRISRELARVAAVVG
ncbi:MAG: IclR family transcriptional regulator [Bacillota bacterium]|nr:IclR family transcriptional regulator [Bacillota bacterium]